MTPQPAAKAIAPDRASRLVLLAIAGVGASAVITQLVLMRELVAAFTGNELIFGLSLGCWLLLTGAGTWLGGRAANIGGARTTSPVSGVSEGGALSPPPIGNGADGAAPSESDSRAASRHKGRVFAAGLVAVALLPLVQVLAVRGLRDAVLPRGAAVGVGGTLAATLALFAPFCLVSGALLTLACRAVSRLASKIDFPSENSEGGAPSPPPIRDGADRAAPSETRSQAAASTGRVYLADTLGSIAGGALFSFALVPWLDHFALLCVPAVAALALAAWLAFRAGDRALAFGAGLGAAAVVAVVATLDVDARSTRWQHRGEIVFRASSPYGRLVVTRDAGQLTFFENGVPLIFSENTGQLEETVHHALAQRSGARRVLLLSGGVAGAAREVLRHDVTAVTCVELDPRMIEAGQRLLPLNLADPRLTLVVGDGRRFVQRTAERFDVIIIDLPDPSTFQLNRFFTAEFFASVRHVLAPDGVLAFGLGRYENFVSPELAQVLASAHSTLRTAFANVRMIPGGRIFFLASDGPLSLDIAARLEARGIATRLVNRHYLDAMLAADRLADLDRAVAQPVAVNTDFNPVLYYYHLRHWLSQFAAPAWLLGGGVLLALAAYLIWLPAVPRVIFASGFAASALEVVLLLAFQVNYGSLYQQVGLVVTVFMAGLAAGAAWANRAVHRRGAESSAGVSPAPPTQAGGDACATAVRGLAGAVAALALALPLVLPRLGAVDLALRTDLAGQMAILVFTFLLAVLVGAQFPLASAASPAATAARLFSADLVGASLGALLVSALLIPLLGVTTVCWTTAGLNLVAALLTFRAPRDA